MQKAGGTGGGKRPAEPAQAVGLDTSGTAAAGYSVKLRPDAEKALDRQDRKSRAAITAKLTTLGVDPRPLGFTPLEGRPDVLRVRVGGLRILYRVDDAARLVTVVAITPRGQAYKPRQLQRL